MKIRNRNNVSRLKYQIEELNAEFDMYDSKMHETEEKLEREERQLLKLQKQKKNRRK